MPKVDTKVNGTKSAEQEPFISFYADSFETWRERHASMSVADAYAEWRRISTELWTKIKASDHYHSGRSCREAACGRYANG